MAQGASSSEPRLVPVPDGAHLATWTAGDGPAMLLVSGLGGTAGFWAPVLPGLSASFRITRFDQRGIGASSRGDAACTIDRLAYDCLAVADARGLDRFLFVGHSTGGAIGQALARLAPERLSGLVLSATWLRPSRYMTALFEARRTILFLDPQAYAATGAILGYAPAWLERNWSTFEAATARPPSSSEARRAVRERIDALIAFDGSQHAASLSVPTLVLGARDDMIVPAFLQEELAAALPGSRKTMLDTGGHFFPVSRPDAFTATVAEWIGELG